MDKRVVIIGAGGHGKVIAEIIKANNDIGKTFTAFKKGLEPIKQEEEGYKTFFKMKTKIASIYNPNNNGSMNSSKKTTRRQVTLSRKKTRRTYQSKR